MWLTEKPSEVETNQFSACVYVIQSVGGCLAGRLTNRWSSAQYFSAARRWLRHRPRVLSATLSRPRRASAVCFGAPAGSVCHTQKFNNSVAAIACGMPAMHHHLSISLLRTIWAGPECFFFFGAANGPESVARAIISFHFISFEIPFHFRPNSETPE